jgi:alanine racemase
MAEGTIRPTWVEIDLEALRTNVRVLRELSHPAVICAVIKADAYGHGAVRVAKAAIEAGVAGLGVAIVEEGIELRQAGITAPILVLSEPPLDAAEPAFEHMLTPTLYSEEGRIAHERAVAAIGGKGTVHVKVDTGMHRVGVPPSEAVDFAAAVESSQFLSLEGFWTHLAVADGDAAEDRAFTDLQLTMFEQHLAALAAKGIRPPVRHALNSAGTIAYPGARFDMVRPGIALFGELPNPAMAEVVARAVPKRSLAPVLSLHSSVVSVRRLEEGERPSYGRLRPLPKSALVATVPIGYADGLPRRYFEAGGEVLIRGRRHPLAGAVTMDQIVVDCGPDSNVAVGDEVVLIGRQRDECIGASEWARLLGTISYEVLTGIGPRVPRVTHAEKKASWGHWLSGMPSGMPPRL